MRPLRADDAAAIRKLIVVAAGGTPYAARMLELVDESLAGGDEARGLVVERDGVVRGAAVHGVIAGAEGAARLHFAVAPAGREGDAVVEELVRAAAAAAAASGARFVMAELADDPAITPCATTLRRLGFAEEGRVADFFRDGVDLLLLRLSLGDAAA